MSILIISASIIVVALYVALYVELYQFSFYADRPECFGSDPGPQQIAEHDCRTCPYALDCLEIFK